MGPIQNTNPSDEKVYMLYICNMTINVAKFLILLHFIVTITVNECPENQFKISLQ